MMMTLPDNQIIFKDVGSGNGTECAMQVIVSYHQYLKTGTINQYYSNVEKQFIDSKFIKPELITNHGGGVPVSAIHEFCQLNFNQNYLILTTSSADGQFSFARWNDTWPNINRQRYQNKKTQLPFILLAHQRHAWLGFPEQSSTNLINPQDVPKGANQQPKDCDCDRFCSIDGQSKHLKSFLASINNELQYSDFVASIKDLNITVQPKISCMKAFNNSEDQFPKYHNETQVEERQSSIVYDDQTDMLYLTSACKGYVKNLHPSSSQRVLKYKINKPDCDQFNSSFRQIGTCFTDLNIETQCNCRKNMIYAMIQRSSKTKACPNPQVIKQFIEFAQQEINNDIQEKHQINYEQMFDIILKNINESGKSHAFKQKAIKSLEILFEKRGIVETYVQTHIKSEITEKGGWPRMISERELTPRLISKLIYDCASEQLYKSKNMIKNLPHSEVMKQVAIRLGSYNRFLCTDISSYDASQLAMIWQIERMYMKAAVDEQSYELWLALTQNAKHAKSLCGQLELITNKCMSSGEMTTSCTNTYLNQLILKFAIDQYKKQQNYQPECDFFVEGDDMIFAHNEQDQFDQLILNTYNDLGFQTTIEHQGDINGASFLKMNLYQNSSGQIEFFKNPCHTFSKLGFTSHKVIKNSPLAYELYRSKLLSLADQYQYSPTMTKFVQASLTIMEQKLIQQINNQDKGKNYLSNFKLRQKQAQIKILEKQYHAYDFKSSETSLVFEEMYSQEIQQMIDEMLSQQDHYMILNSADYPIIFKDLQPVNKRTDFQFKDPHRTRSQLTNAEIIL